MGLDATTYILEILNFLVLVWLLRRFLFRPLLDGVKQRQAAQQQERKALQQAQAKLDQAQAQLAAEQAHQAEARRQAEQQLQEDIDALRQQHLSALEEELNQVRTQAEARLAIQARQQVQAQHQAAHEQARQFLASYLQRLAGPALEQAIIELFISDLKQLDEAQRQCLSQAPADESLRIHTAYPPAPHQRQQLETLLMHHWPGINHHWQQDGRLLAGISVERDGHVLEASLANGLSTFNRQLEESP